MDILEKTQADWLVNACYLIAAMTARCNQEGFNIDGTDFDWVAFLKIMQNRARIPVDVGFLCGGGLILQANGIKKLIENFLEFWRG